MSIHSAETFSRFMEKVETSPDGCWEWRASRHASGYGQFGIGGRAGRPHLAHRVSYEIAKGLIPAGLQIDHLCRNRGCVNPAHLEAVTQRVNSLRGVTISAENFQKTKCKHGHAFDAINTYVRPSGHRSCRHCHRLEQRRRSRKT